MSDGEGRELVMYIRPECGGPWLIVASMSELDGVVSGNDDDEVYEVKFKRMTKEEQEALGEFGGW